MIAIVLRALFANRVTSTLTGAALVIGLAYGWHMVDRSSAVRQALVGYVARVELAAVEAELAEVKRQLAAAGEAARMLARRAAQSQSETADLEMEIQAYEAENKINPDGVVGGGLAGRLRGN